MSTLLWLLTEAGLVLCWLVTPWAPAPWLALCWLLAPLAGWLALLLTRKRSQVRLTCPVTAEKGKPFSVTAEVRQGVPFGRGRLTVSVENTVTGETHREKLTLHQGRGAWQVQSACCGCLVMQAAELVLWDLLGVSISTAYEVMHEPSFPTLRVGSRMVVPKEKFIQWAEEQSGGAK